MSRILYFFVDESGNASNGSSFSLVGCWCVSQRTNEREVFTPTKSHLLSTVRDITEDSSISEIKSASLRPHVLDSAMGIVQREIHSDKTLDDPRVWDSDQPIRYSTYTTVPDLTTDIFNGRSTGSLSAGQMTRCMSLISVVSPLLQSDLTDLDHVDEVRVILDDSVWDNPARIVGECFENLPSMDIQSSFTTADSKSVPGLQLADMAAYSWLRNQREGDCSYAKGVVDDYRF
ncbi:hypothetical protein ELS19_19935 [Halogeometricum borinquense]|uniref:DUF3800 domain-containing protein n=1 Tax=Halogeometricum borinquense TaxID=60847 RepID=A0A482SZW9_9EURY|nr:DUF3800 domain-containing protein [Halogeometricum borinquense]RYJ07760.1 hypothetical protein ELS19_19935 [Halogeometricum borinquense]